MKGGAWENPRPKCGVEGCGERFPSLAERNRHRKREHGKDPPIGVGQYNRILDLQRMTGQTALLDGISQISELTQTQADRVISRMERALLEQDRVAAK